MASQKAWYWLAAGVLALGLNSEYQSGKFQLIHHYLDHSLAVADEYARCAGRYLAQAHLLLSLTHADHGRPAMEDAAADSHNLLLNEQVQYAVAQAEMARQELDQHRPELEKALRDLQMQRSQLAIAQRFASDDALQGLTVCPHSQHIRVSVPQVRIPQVSVAVPQIHVQVPSLNVEVPSVRVQVPEINVAPIDDSDNTL